LNPYLDRNLDALRRTIGEAKPRKPRADFQFKKPLHHGWLLPYLLDADLFLWQRWHHWYLLHEAGRLIGDIPQIAWSSEHRGPAFKMLERCLNCITTYGDWQGWSSHKHFDFFMDWLLFGFGDQAHKEEPKESSDQAGASARLYQVFNLETMLAYPGDYFGDILAENKHGRSQGFFPTPMELAEMMTQMQMDTGEDMRAKTVCDPCVGTGRMILAASNFSYRLFCQDISLTVLKACKVNGWLYAPWLVRPLPESFWQDCPPRASEQPKQIPAITTEPRSQPTAPQLELTFA